MGLITEFDLPVNRASIMKIGLNEKVTREQMIYLKVIFPPKSSSGERTAWFTELPFAFPMAFTTDKVCKNQTYRVQ